MLNNAIAVGLLHLGCAEPVGFRGLARGVVLAVRKDGRYAGVAQRGEITGVARVGAGSSPAAGTNNTILF